MEAESVFARFLSTLSAADLLKEQSCRTSLLGLPHVLSFFLNFNWNLEGWDKVDAEDESGTDTAVGGSTGKGYWMRSGRRRCIHSFRQGVVTRSECLFYLLHRFQIIHKNFFVSWQYARIAMLMRTGSMRLYFARKVRVWVTGWQSLKSRWSINFQTYWWISRHSTRERVTLEILTRDT